MHQRTRLVLIDSKLTVRAPAAIAMALLTLKSARQLSGSPRHTPALRSAHGNDAYTTAYYAGRPPDH